MTPTTVLAEDYTSPILNYHLVQIRFSFFLQRPILHCSFTHSLLVCLSSVRFPGFVWHLTLVPSFAMTCVCDKAVGAFETVPSAVDVRQWIACDIGGKVQVQRLEGQRLVSFEVDVITKLGVQLDLESFHLLLVTVYLLLHL